MVTIKEIASECGLSPTAVSKALSGKKDISEETIKRVKKAAKKMGYIRNPAAVRLKTKRSYNFGVLLEDDSNRGITHEFFASILHSFILKSREKGYTVTFISNRLGEDIFSYSEYTKMLGCDGVIILSTKFEDPEMIEFVKGDVPIVTVDYSYNSCSSIFSDNEHAISEMVNYAYEMGHRKIAYIHGELTAVTKIRLASFYNACDALGIEVKDGYVQSGVFHNPDSAEKCTYELFKLQEPPTFIFYQDDFAFLGGINAFEKLGIQYPEDVSVAGFDGQHISQAFKPKLMTWKQDAEKIGEEAVNLLLAAIEKPKSYIPRSVQVKGELLKGRSVKDIGVRLQTDDF